MDSQERSDILQEEDMLSVSSVDTSTSVSAFTMDTNMSMTDQMTCAIAATQLRMIPITRHTSLDPGILRCPICSFFTTKRKQFLLHMAHEGCPSQYNQIDYIAVMVQLINHSASDDVSASSSEDEVEGGGGKADHARKRKKPERKRETHLEMKKCTFCDLQMAKGTQEYYAHLRTHLPEGFVCIKCSFVAQHNHHLLFHWFSAHETYRPFKCHYKDDEKNSNCKYRCISKSMLASHEKVHLQFYQYRCDTCDYKTRHKSSLKKHLELTNHVPSIVLNVDGTPNPDVIIDLNSRKRGPRQRRDARIMAAAPTTTSGGRMSDDGNSDYRAAMSSYYQLNDTTNSSCANSQCGTPEVPPSLPPPPPLPVLPPPPLLSNSNINVLMNDWTEFYKRYANLWFRAGIHHMLNSDDHPSYTMESVQENEANRSDNSLEDVAERCSMTSKSPDEIVLRNNARNTASTAGYSSELFAREIVANNSDGKADDSLNDIAQHAGEKRSVMPEFPEKTPNDIYANNMRQVDLVDFNTYTEDINGAMDEPFNLSLRKTIRNLDATQLQTRPVVTSLLTSVKTRNNNNNNNNNKDTRKRTESEELEPNKSAKLKCIRSDIPVFPTIETKNEKNHTATSTGSPMKNNEHSELGSRFVTYCGGLVNITGVNHKSTKNDSKSSHLHPFACVHCELTFRNLIMFDEHMGYHDTKNPLQCRKCREEYRNSVGFFKHIGSRPH